MKLLKDLCARLPYNVKFCIEDFVCTPRTLKAVCKDGRVVCEDIHRDIDQIKPYLFPLSSMTEEQKEEFDQLLELELEAINNEINHTQATAFEVDFYHKHHLDWRGLIPMRLALDATGLNIY